MIGSLILHGKNLLSSGLLGLYSLNTLAFAVVCANIGFFGGEFSKEPWCTSGSSQRDCQWTEFLGRSIRTSVNHEQTGAGCLQISAVILVHPGQ